MVYIYLETRRVVYIYLEIRRVVYIYLGIWQGKKLSVIKRNTVVFYQL